jgi:hypothetical protein
MKCIFLNQAFLSFPSKNDRKLCKRIVMPIICECYLEVTVGVAL